MPTINIAGGKSSKREYSGEKSGSLMWSFDCQTSLCNAKAIRFLSESSVEVQHLRDRGIPNHHGA